MTKHTYRPYPTQVLKEVRNADGSLSITLQQQRFLADGGSEGEQVWFIPLFFGTEGGLSGGEGGGAILMTEQVQTFQLPASRYATLASHPYIVHHTPYTIHHTLNITHHAAG
ncbi:hypothetical protein EON63_03805 [archaeon]|nr:MAG: hypothetical protein EON63_03805 [archaeon]